MLSQKGRYFRKEIDGQLASYMLMYNHEGQLRGMYTFSKNEMPSPPWELVGGLRGVPELDEHWALEVTFRSPRLACGPRKLASR